MADFTVKVDVRGDGFGTPESAEELLAARAADIALDGLRAIWPVATGRSRDGLTVSGPSVVGSADYTDQVRRRGSATPIVDSDARVIGESAAAQAAAEIDTEIANALDGALTELLTSMER